MVKEIRYKWSSPDRMGTFALISKNDLRVDSGYQRDVIDRKALRIASGFSWPAFGAILVARRSDGSRWVVDGQHRHAAAMQREDVDLLPCMMFDSAGDVIEAGDFLASNTERKPVTAIEKFRAQMKVGDVHAVAVDSMLRDAQRTLSENQSGSTIRCVALLMKLVSTPRFRAPFLRVWPVVVMACHGEQMAECVIDGLTYIEANLPDGVSISDRRWSSRIAAIGSDGLTRAARSGAAFCGAGGARAWAFGILQAVNHKLQDDRRLVLRNDAK